MILQVDLVTAVRLATPAASILVGSRAVHGVVVVHSVPAFRLLRRLAGGGAVALIGVWAAKKYARASLEQRVVAIVRLRP